MTSAVVFFIVKDNLPYNIVEKQGFRNLVMTMNSRYKIPGRKTVKKLIENRYEIIKNAYTLKFKAEVNHVCLTTDIWTDSLNNISYIGK